MKLPRLRTVLLIPVVLFALFYLTMAVVVLLDDRVAEPLSDSSIEPVTVAIFGGSGTAGDGILKAALASSDIDKIHVVTRRTTPRMEEGVASGKLQVTVHMDYLDYSAVINEFNDVDAVYWALGISSVGVDEETYGMIHVDFPVQFVTAWLGSSAKTKISFHYISSSDISDESTAMWAREKVRAEKALFALAEGSKLRVIAFRPDYIGPTAEEAHIGQDILYWFFAPVKAAVRATRIGEAMIEVSFRPSEFKNGDKLHTGKIVRYSEAYQSRKARSATSD